MWFTLLSIFCTFGCGSGSVPSGDKSETPSATEASSNAGDSSSATQNADREIVIAMLPKLTTIAYFEACRVGAEKAVADLNAEGVKVKLIYDGPSDNSGSEQTKFIDTWIRQKVDAICVAPNQPKTMKRFVEKAHAAGITFLTWDSDAEESGRDLMVNQVDDQVLGQMLMDDLAAQMQEEGEWAIAIASLDAHNLNSWRRIAEARALDKYPKLKLVNTVVTEED
ncbi:MAG: substrate-binding domain-containing protein, partial [Planctomycetaceae bacterium]